MFKGKKFVLIAWTALLSLTLALAGCGKSEKSGGEEASAGPVQTIEELAPLAKKEGKVISVGMPDTWANWKDTWDQLTSKYGLEHSDTDMGSADEINKFAAEKNKPTADIGDVGIAFGPVAVEKGVTQPYKTQYWDEVPDWAKDKDGHWMVAYTGTMSILCNKELIKGECPKSYADLENAEGKYKIAVGDVVGAAQAQYAVLAAAIAHGGDEGNIQPGIDFFKKLAEKGLLSKVDVTVANIEKGEVAVALLWDFNSLGYRDRIGDQFEANIPTEGSVTSGYATIINKYAPHPNAAKLARAYIFSDEGQINLAKGYARPIRTSVKLPTDVEAKLIPADQYKNAKPVNDYKVWEKTAKELSVKWQEEVQISIK